MDCGAYYDYLRAKKFQISKISIFLAKILFWPQIRSMASVLFEGKPFLPDPGMMWSLCERYKVDHLLTAPTTVRELIK